MMCTDLAVWEQFPPIDTSDSYLPSLFSTINPVSLVLVPCPNSTQTYVLMYHIVENGRKIYGPPLNYFGPRPSYSCELYINRLPAHLDEIALLQCFCRLGNVYEMRVMMQSSQMSTRGYAFIRYTCEEDAMAACKLFNFLFLNGKRLNVCRSVGKNRIFIGGIPKQMSPKDLLHGFKAIFPQMRTCNVFPAPRAEYYIKEVHESKTNLIGNRGFAFLTFEDHDAALEAKRKYSTGAISIWGCPLSVKWAKSKDAELMGGRAFINELHNSGFYGNYFFDYSAILRFYCMANNWCVPVVIFGGNIRNRFVQYGAILLKDATSNSNCFIMMEITVTNVYDVHLLMCEVAIRIISRECAFPKYHYIVRVKYHSRLEIVHSYAPHIDWTDIPLAPYFINIRCIFDLKKCLQQLGQYSSDALLIHYKKSFLQISDAALPEMILKGQEGNLSFYAIYPKYRNNSSLTPFNDTEITLLLNCSIYSESTYSKSNLVVLQQCEALKLRTQRPDIHPDYVLQYVDIQNNLLDFYHPAQRMNTHPTWIQGHSYQHSLRSLW